MLNPEQEAAVAAITTHCLAVAVKDSFLVLEGPAGTGKTFCMSQVVERVKKRIVFTAPTNKAVKVLRESIKAENYNPLCKTIYSLLGLRMEANGEVKELKAPDEEDAVDLSEVSVVVIDEGSMLNEQLIHHIKMATKNHPKIRWIIMGDRWQLPPVGEAMSKIWELPQALALTKIMRQDNTIVQLGETVRQLIETPFKALKLVRTEDVRPVTTQELIETIMDDAAAFLNGTSKAIAWRNIKVDQFNSFIRRRLFAEHGLYPWQPGDRITMLGPIKDLLKTNPETGEHPLIATTDEEGVVESCDRAEHPEFKEFDCWRIVFRSDFNTSATLFTLHSDQTGKFATRVARLAAEARESRRWDKFWDFKDAFHPIRHAYAITAHRAQGSTYKKAYVNWRDVLLNPNRAEAYRCLYVAVTRPKELLYLG